MVVTTLSQIVEDKISLLKELINHKNSPQVNDTYQIQIDTIRSIDDYGIEKLESIISQKKELLKNCKTPQETERLLAEIDALEWLQRQIERYS